MEMRVIITNKKLDLRGSFMIIFQKEFGYEEQYRGSIKNTKYKIRSHIHQFSELVYVIDGVLDAVVDGRKYSIHPGEIAIITPFQMHEFSSLSTVKFYMCVFANNCVPNYHVDVEFFHNRESAVFKATDSIKAQINDMLETIEHPYYVTKSGVPRKIKAMFYSVFSEFVTQVPNVVSAKKNDVLSSLFLYLNEHYKEKINLKIVGKALGYNPKYVSQCLSALPDMTFPTILNSLRVDHAKNLLLNSDFKIIDIAYECGFESEQSFHRTFLKIAGMTPGEYRKNSVKH